MSGVSGESATIYVSDPARLRDYFLRLGANAVVENHAVRVEHVGDGADDNTIDAHLRHWVERNGIAASVGPPQAPVLVPAPAPRVETAPPAARDLFVERPRLGDLLLSRGLITMEQLESALAESRTTGDLLGRVLIRRRVIFGDELARTLADQLQLPYVNLGVVGYDPSVSILMPSTLAIAVGVLPIGRLCGQVRVAFADPSDETAIKRVETFVGEHSVVVADLLEIELAWRRVDPAADLRVTAVG